MSVIDFILYLIEQHKLVRRLVLLWACVIITIAVLRYTDPEVIGQITGPAATVFVAIIGILATVIGFYQHNRQKDRDDG